MKDKEQVRTLEDLRAHFDINKAIAYFLDGKLMTWLEDRYYEEEANSLSNLQKDDPDLNKKLCKILGVDYIEEETDPKTIEERNKKLTKLKQYTADEKILNKVDLVAFNQEDLADLLDEGRDEIYLCQNKFVIPLSQKNKKYIGVGKVEAIIRSKMKVDFKELGISFINIDFDSAYESILNQSPKRIMELAEQAEENEDYTKALYLYRKGAALGDSEAMMAIANMYNDGKGIEQDNNQALMWLKKAVDKNNIRAILTLAFIYLDGAEDLCIEKNISQAISLLKKAAKLGSTEAMNNIGFMYYNGEGVNQDKQEAKKWYEESANKGDTTAMCNLAYIYRMGDGAVQNYKKAIEWYEKAMEKNNAEAVYEIGTMFDNGEGFPPNKQQALQYFEKAANLDSAEAMFSIGYMYEHGDGVNQDKQNAVYWYKKSAEAGNAIAMNNLGYMYHCGEGTVKNFSTALKWYQKAAKLGNTTAMINIANMYEEGCGVKKNYSNAISLYKKAAEEGDIDAMKKLANIYENGSLGVKANKARANQWYQKAADAGDKESIEKLNNDDGCFITTAVCNSFHKPDNCYELTMFRAFRDNWLKKQSDGKELIAKYYAIAPEIVNNINKFADADKIYLNIWRKYLKPCLSYIEQGKNEQCKSVYMQMVNDLYKKFIN